MNSIALEKIHDTLNFRNIVLVVGFLALVCIVFYYNSLDINLKTAYKGYGPQDYVAQKMHPENFQRDFAPGMILIYDHSIPMRTYYYLAKYCGISPSIAVYPFMFLQTLLFLLSVAFLSQTLFKDMLTTYIIVVVVSVSNLAGINLSKFGSGYGSLLSFPLFYGYSNAFSFFAIGSFLRNKYILCFVFLALSIYCHVSLGVFAVLFVGAYLLCNPRLFLNNKVIIGILLFCFLVIPHVISIMNQSSMSSGSIPIEQWIKSTRIFGYHWYPLTRGLFTKEAHLVFFPLIISCFFLFASLRYHDVKAEKHVKIFLGLSACAVLSILGVILSDIYPIPFLIKISFQRSSQFITLFAVFYIIHYLLKKMQSGNIYIFLIASYSLFVLVFSKPGIAVLPLLLLFYFDICEGYIGPYKIHPDRMKIAKYCYFTAGFVLFLLFIGSMLHTKLVAINILYTHLWEPLMYFNPFYKLDFLIRGGVFKIPELMPYLIILALLSAAICSIFKKSEMRGLSLFCRCFFIIGLCTSMVWIVEYSQYAKWKHSRDVSTSYYDVQKWAKNHTSSSALFMPDPSHCYGWRDFSERSSFGNLREWGYCAICYNPDYESYIEGNKRMKEFGIDIDKITNADLKNSNYSIYGQKLIKDIREYFYNMQESEIKNLTAKYNIDYIVMKKNYHKKRFINFAVVYENDHYIVYSA